MPKPAAAPRLPASRSISPAPAGEHWRLSPAPDANALRLRLDRLDVRLLHEEHHRLAFYDDHDRHLWLSGWALSDNRRRWRLLDATGELAACPVRRGKPVRFWQDFPPGPLQDLLRPRLGVRALLPLGAMTFHTARLELRDDDDKLVLRLTLARLEPEEGLPVAVVGLHPLRGYEEEADSVRLALGNWLAQPVDDCGLMTLLRLDGRLAPPSAPGFRLDPAMPVETALRGRCELLLREARRLESHLIADTDTEFLHQYRVLLRKARSQLRLLRDALPADLLAPALTALGEAATQTNVLRDLDVFLLDSDDWRRRLPPEHAAGFQKLHALIQRDRRQALRTVARSLESVRYREAMDDVLARLRETPRAGTPIAETPVLDAARERLGRHARKLARLAAALGPQSPDEDIHALRIEFKKLRYLLEFFGDLAPPRKLSALVKELKELQGILGDFNDASVQRAFLLACLRTRPLDVEATAAIHGLIAVLHQQQLALRPQAIEAVGRFHGDAAEKRLRRLFPRPARKPATTPADTQTKTASRKTTTEGS